MADWSQAAVEVANLIDDLEGHFVDDTDEIEIGRVMIVVEVMGEVGTDHEWTGIHTRCNDGARWIQVGLLHAALRVIDASSDRRGEDDT